VISVGEARGLVLAGSAVLPFEGADTVLVLRDGRAQRVSVRIGAVGQGQVQIESGLAAGDLVVARPDRVKPGQRARAMAAGP
jgi:HlyD family secretion protein